MQYLAHTLTNKLLHGPTVQIRRAGASARHELVAAARTLYDLESRSSDSDSDENVDDDVDGNGGGNAP